MACEPGIIRTFFPSVFNIATSRRKYQRTKKVSLACDKIKLVKKKRANFKFDFGIPMCGRVDHGPKTCHWASICQSIRFSAHVGTEPRKGTDILRFPRAKSSPFRSSSKQLASQQEVRLSYHSSCGPRGSSFSNELGRPPRPRSSVFFSSGSTTDSSPTGIQRQVGYLCISPEPRMCLHDQSGRWAGSTNRQIPFFKQTAFEHGRVRQTGRAAKRRTGSEY